MVALVASFVNAGDSPPVPAPWRILVILGGDLSLPSAQLHERSFRTALQAVAPGPVTFFVESIDAQRFDARSLEPETVALLAKKYRQQPVDLIIATGDGTLDFVHRNHAALWPGTPVMFSAVSSALISADSPIHNYPYLTWKLDVQGTLEMVRALQPEATRLVVIGGTSRFDQMQVDEVMAVARLQNHWATEVWNTFTIDTLREKLAGTPAQTAVLYTTMFRDASGLPLFPADALQRMASGSGAPVYGMYATYMGRGVVAGRFIDYQEMGHRAAKTAVQILTGTPLDTQSLQETIKAHCLADYQQLQAYKLQSGALPADCQIRNMPRNLWTQYRELVVAGLAVILLQAVTIGALLQQRRRLRLAEMRGSQQRDELSRAMRFAAMGELTASIAHEINQPLGAILNNAKTAEMLLAQGADTPQEMRAILTDIRRDNERAHAVIQRLRRLLSKGEAAHGPVHLHATIQESLAILKPEALRRGIAMELDLSAPTDRLSGDSVQLQQVLINLALNAMDAMANTGLGQRLLALATCHHAGQLQLQVRDTGAGIAESAMATIFDSFYTTKSDGMGLGLPIVRTIVQAHHGTVSVDSRPGQGTTFTLRFPLLPRTR